MKALEWAAVEVIKMRELLLYHWHCILPAIGIIAALFFIMNKNTNNKNKDKKSRLDDGESRKNAERQKQQ